MWIRHVLVPGWSDQADIVERQADFVGSLKTVERVEVLPFHKMGEFKWQERALPYRLADTRSPTRDEAESVRNTYRARGLRVD